MRIDGNVDERNLASRFARFLSRLRIVIERMIETDRYRSCETLWSGTVTANTAASFGCELSARALSPLSLNAGSDVR